MVFSRPRGMTVTVEETATGTRKENQKQTTASGQTLLAFFILRLQGRL
jgi:hypothetical protein